MKTLRFLACVAAVSALCACGQEPTPADQQSQQEQTLAASAADLQQPAPAAASEQASPASSALSAQGSGLSSQGSGLSSQGSGLSAQGSGLSGTETGFNIEINLSSDVLFDFDKADLKPEADAELQKAAEVIRRKGQGLILITGHTDSKGSDAYNQRLSLARAQAVKSWFEAQGLHQNYQIEGLGATRPIAPNTHPDGSDNPEGRAQNRRVEIIVNKTTQLGS
ncbi:OmpA family protein [Eikenella sp. Marseille-P7795]|uniref:OmpA family protein n=1 Tax=Eikenella sp. Marseille-P7795 TaxID=2866577 RepID=UPI001CE48A5E|nr:OmpA family protein [Eikenella sp. Marseille-P7795]